MIKIKFYNAKSGRNNIVLAYSITYSISLSCIDMDMAYGMAPYGLSYSIRLWIEALLDRGSSAGLRLAFSYSRYTLCDIYIWP